MFRHKQNSRETAQTPEENSAEITKYACMTVEVAEALGILNKPANQSGEPRGVSPRIQPHSSAGLRRAARQFLGSQNPIFG